LTLLYKITQILTIKCYNSSEVITMALVLGEINELEVIRETDFSYILSDGESEIMLHFKQLDGEVEIGDKVSVFLYYDNQRRITATMKIPYIGIHSPGFVKVVGVNPRLGVFLDIGLIKDLLLSRDDLPFKKSEWPDMGDTLFVRIKSTKNQLTAKIIPRYEIRNYLTPKTELIEGEYYKAYCVFIAEEGLVFTTLEGHYIFVYYKHLRKTYRLGEAAQVKITIAKIDKEYNGTLVDQKEIMLTKDALTIREYLEKHDGCMNLTDKSDPEDIMTTFKMSKAAFKRAIGTLYKEKVVILKADSTCLVKQVEKTE